MLDRGIEAELVPYCLKKGMAILAYSPLALGLLTGRIGPERQFTGDDQRISDPRFSVENRQKVAALLEQFRPIADRYQVTLGQLVIAWTLRQPGITHVLCGARNPQQALENTKAGVVTLDDGDLNAMNSLIQTHAASIV
jgi:aryl-alcohol dehydrogenase-like predicted oxidoreductase